MPSDPLWVMPSWLSGVSRTLDLSGHFDEYNDYRTGPEADAKALYAAWRAVGESIGDALTKAAEPSCPKRCDVASPPEPAGTPGRYVCVCCGTEFPWPPPGGTRVVGSFSGRSS